MNNTFYDNSSGVSGFAGAIILRNNLFWENGTNATGDDFNFGDVEYCLTQANSNYSSGTGILNNVNPLFVNVADPDGADNLFGTAHDGLRLRPTSPLIRWVQVQELPLRI